VIKIVAVGEMTEAARRIRASGRTIGFVPTMGFLHEGHLSLVRAAREASDAVVVSIFINPIQFGPAEDLRTYPRDLARDTALLDREGVEIVFCPEAAEMYPEGFRTFVRVESLEDKLCGQSRPGHFRGVCTVVLKLFEIVRPDAAFFGRKDAQQALILERMARDLNLGIRIDVRPIVREPDGLAMSSRNSYLTAEERRAALVLFRSLSLASGLVAAGERSPGPVLAGMRSLIAAEPLARIDYIEAVNPADLEPADRLRDGTLIALAVLIGRTRLIDNMSVELPKG